MRTSSIWSPRIIGAVAAMMAVVVACGQKPGVHVATEGQQAGSADVAADGSPDGSGQPTAGPTSVGAGEGPAGGAVGNLPQQGGGAAAPGTAQQPGQSVSSGSGATYQVRGSDRTGVTDTTITLAAHAPVTGAAPLPAVVFEESADLYWRWIREQGDGKVLGRDIEIAFQDDRYTPTTARQICRQLMQVGFIMSGVGADGIGACAPLAAQLEVPYISFGADEGALAGNPWYFAVSATYPQQSELWSQYMRRHFPGQKVGAIAIDTVNWNASVEAWQSGLANKGIEFRETLRHPREGTDWYAPFARQLNDDGVEVVFALTSPLHLIRFAQVARDNGYDFHLLYLAPGTLNAILENGCPAMENATSFSTWPSLDVIDQVDPDFMRAVERFDISRNDLDLSLALWGVNKTAHHMFLEYGRRYGNDLTREDFRDMMETITISTGLFPDQAFTPSNHFGTRPGVHVVTADCDREIWADAGTFRTGF